MEKRTRRGIGEVKEMKYRYVELKDRLGQRPAGIGRVWYAGKPGAELAEELGLQAVHDAVKRDELIGYTTSLTEMGERGWELQFVTPCGYRSKSLDHATGEIDKSYIIKKEF